jgi:monoamine oxidase
VTLPTDVAIIGAGAAGLSAARHLADHSKLSTIILEARNRIGGRTHTIAPAPGIVFDTGAGWLHSADENAFVRIARELGFAIDKTPANWGAQMGDRKFSKRDQRAFGNAIAAFYERLHEAAQKPWDVAASRSLTPNGRWNAAIDAISTYINGAELDRVSAKDTNNYRDTELNWRVAEGYGALVAAYGAPCKVALGAPVTKIDHSGDRLKIETTRGEVAAHAVIVAVPTPMIAQEKIRFTPALPDKVGAAEGLPLGVANKIVFLLTAPDDYPANAHLRGSVDRVDTGSYHLRPLGKPTIEGFFGGACAREHEAEGALAAFATNELADLLGNDIRGKITLLAATAWASDPFALGSYSHALPGHAGARARLAAPVDERIFFAGEATHPHFFSTAHGAYESGARAAEDVIRAFEKAR